MVMQARCPACQAPIEVKEDQAITVCLACGKVIRIPDDLEPEEHSAGAEVLSGQAGQRGASTEVAEASQAAETGSSGEAGGQADSGTDGASEGLAEAESGGRVAAGRPSDAFGDVDSRRSRKGSVQDSGVPTGEMDAEEAETSEMGPGEEPAGRKDRGGVKGNDPSAGLVGSVSDRGPGHDRDKDDEDPLERVPTTRFKRVETSRTVEDEELLLDIGGIAQSDRVEVSSTSSVLRFETTCPACGRLMGVEGAEVPESLACPHCGTEVDVAGQIAAMLGNSGLLKQMSAQQERELKAWLDRRIEAGGAGSSARDESQGGGRAEQVDGGGEEIDVVQTYCPHCKSLISLDAALLEPGTLCPNCGQALLPDGEDSDSQGGTKSNSFALIVGGIVVALFTLGLVGFLLSSSGSGSSARSSAAVTPGLQGRLTLSGSLGDRVIVPTTCRSGRALGYNGVELQVGRSGPSVRLVDSAAGKYAVVTSNRSAEPVKLSDCNPFVLKMKRSGIKTGAHWLMDGQADLVCRDRSGKIALQGRVWFQRCP